MDPIQRIQEAVDYIDANLSDELDLETISSIAGFSLSHFHKLFLAATGFTIKTYIRSKRLSMAARELKMTKRRILDIAIEAGFESQEAFTRSFTALYQITPAQYRSIRSEIIQFDKHTRFGKELERRYSLEKPRMRFEAKIMERGPIYLVGKGINTSVVGTIEDDLIPKFWRDVFIPQIPGIKNIKTPYVSIGYEIHNPEQDMLFHMAAVETTTPDAPEGLDIKILGKSQYAVFAPEKPLNAIEYSQLILFAYGEWLPMKGLQQAEDHTLDIRSGDHYFSGYSDDNGRLEVHIPVK